MKTVILPEEIAEIAEWIVEQINANSFCEVGAVFSIHASEIRRVDRTLTTKFMPTKKAAAHEKYK
ncbi:hypothetical protein [Marispirochaeta aestuarii]|uniref:hypothetical protein n=1 Tax=Marispirochaeta aestuarii TaxID=1963862 RepID=UPI001301AB2F|nr:hypothetical protein [Marispirochaeta aestuarii]